MLVALTPGIPMQLAAVTRDIESMRGQVYQSDGTRHDPAVRAQRTIEISPPLTVTASALLR